MRSMMNRFATSLALLALAPSAWADIMEIGRSRSGPSGRIELVCDIANGVTKIHPNDENRPIDQFPTVYTAEIPNDVAISTMVFYAVEQEVDVLSGPQMPWVVFDSASASIDGRGYSWTLRTRYDNQSRVDLRRGPQARALLDLIQTNCGRYIY